MPDIMFSYRSVTFLTRIHYPEVLMGMRTLDELEDIGALDQPVEDHPRTIEELTKRLGVPDVVDQAPEQSSEAASTESAEATSTPAEDKPDLSKPNGVENHVTSPEKWKEMPGLSTDLFADLMAATTPEAVDAVFHRHFEQVKGDEDKEAIVQTASDGRKAELRASQARSEESKQQPKGSKKQQGKLVD
jgi:hypothetical protein